MGRLTDAILSGAYSNSIARPMLDVSKTGYQGWAPDLTNWVSNQAHLEGGQMICLLVEAPKMFTVLPDSPKWIASLKSLFETHARNIDGMNAGLKVDTDEHAVGGGGEMHQEFTNVTRERSQPKFQFVEKYGRPIQKLLDNWIRYGMMDPEAKFAMVATLGRDKIPTDLLADWYSMSCLFFEPDPTHQTIEKAWVGANMWPKGTNTVEGKKDKTAASELLNLSIEWTGFYDSSIGSKVFAQRILDSINQVNANPYLRPSFIQNLAPDVDAALKNYKKELENLGSSAIVPTSGNG